MKKNLSLMLALIFCVTLLVSGCANTADVAPDTTVPETTAPAAETTAGTPVSQLEETPDWLEDGALKILTIGNSFSDDATKYMCEIAQDLGVEKVVIGNLYISGCTLEIHYRYLQKDVAGYTYRLNTGDGWENTKDYISGNAIKSENWDFISMQQSSKVTGLAEGYALVGDLADAVRAVAGDGPKLVWHMTWAYQNGSSHEAFPTYNNDQLTMYNGIVSAVKSEVVTNGRISAIIPNGTSIQNARTSYLGDTLTRDGYHLTKDIGRYIAGLTFIKALTGLSIDNISYVPEGVDEGVRKIAVEAANNAVAHPFTITQSAYTQAPA